MANNSSNFTTLQKAGLAVFVIGNIVASEEMVPGWGFNMGLPRPALYALALVTGAVGGAMIAAGYVLPGIVGGTIASLGALWVTTMYLASVTTSHSAIMFLCGAAGSIPGIAIGFGLKFVQDKMRPSTPTAPT